MDGLKKTYLDFFSFKSGSVVVLLCGTSVVVVVPYCSCCLYLYFGSAVMLVTYFVHFR